MPTLWVRKLRLRVASLSLSAKESLPGDGAERDPRIPFHGGVSFVC